MNFYLVSDEKWGLTRPTEPTLVTGLDIANTYDVPNDICAFNIFRTFTKKAVFNLSYAN